MLNAQRGFIGLDRPIFLKRDGLPQPYDDIDPGVTEKLDYEVELGAVIGARAKRVSEGDALDHVFGYFVANNVSARDWQFHTLTFTMGKSFDTHGPIGPWIVTADEISDPQSLDLRAYVNGQLWQQNNTANMIHSLRAQIAYLTTAFTLEPGDLIATGTPEGVGVGMDPPTSSSPVTWCGARSTASAQSRTGSSGPTEEQESEMAVLGALSVTLEVPDLDPGVKFYTDAGLIADVQDNTARLRCDGQDRDSILLLGGASRKRLHHISLRADDLDAIARKAPELGGRVVAAPAPSRTTAYGSKIRTAC